MSAHPIRIFPDTILRKKCPPVIDFGPTLERLAAKMIQIMRSQPSGIGIAAPQIGINMRLAIVDVSARIKSAKLKVLVNPVIMEKSDERPSREGCMSLPDYTAFIKRYDRIQLRWSDQHGEEHEQEFQGLEAACIQHEIDHLDGLLFIDRVVSLKQDMIPRPRSRK